jgi:hypothetical protein
MTTAALVMVTAIGLSYLASFGGIALGLFLLGPLL